MKNCSGLEKREILKIIKRKNKKPGKIIKVQQFVKEKGGIDYTIQRMNEYKDKALAILDTFSDNEAKKSLQNFVVFTIERNK